ncbi:uncharacterized protein LOC119405270 [Rhipicephalus sanguineus]|uniref:BHLH domain-containing protein n=1 Tax=Rhipicephalus sanguineus TaxID=34632 RepID=A0A9D4SMN6_RHISA|nr:uncharacterized protein LOC119405270 [Rhipicephalus sanguineus]KAH7934832.1 hypothetical protein HPB52_001016 [Rhipicephalus sanguineus]
MEDFLSLDFDTSDCSWKLWDGIEQEPCYFDGLLELDFVSDLGVSDLGLCTSSSDDTSLGLSTLLEATPVLTNDCCEQQLQLPSPEGEEDTSPDSCDLAAMEATPLDAYDAAAPAFPKARNQAKATSRNAARERSRVRSLRSAFQALQSSLPSVPPDTKLSKLDILVLASNYIAHLGALLSDDEQQHSDDSSADDSPGREVESANSRSYLHPVKKWPMRSRLYAGAKPYADDRSRRQAGHFVATKKSSKNAWRHQESMT